MTNSNQTPSDPILLAIIDTGSNFKSHGNYLHINDGEIAGDGIDNDGNGYIDDVSGIDLLMNDIRGTHSGSKENQWVPGGKGHGDNMTKQAVSRFDAMKDYAGSDPELRIMNIDIADGNGAYTSTARDAVVAALKSGAKVMNLSFNFKYPSVKFWLEPVLKDTDAILVLPGSAGDNTSYGDNIAISSGSSVVTAQLAGDIASLRAMDPDMSLADIHSILKATSPSEENYKPDMEAAYNMIEKSFSNPDGFEGTNDVDKFNAARGDDILNGYGGDDHLRGGAGDDIVNGGDGNDTIHGGVGDDVLNGGDGNDTIHGGAGDDVLNGGDGDDRFNGEIGRNIIDGGDGTDRIKFDKRINQYDITVSKDTDNISTFIIKENDSSITILKNIERFQFRDIRPTLEEMESLYATKESSEQPTPKAVEAKNDSISMSEDGVAQIDILANDKNADLSLIQSVEVVSKASLGQIEYANGKFKYTADANKNGKDSFVYRVTDIHDNESTATVNINVTPVNDTPDAKNDTPLFFAHDAHKILKLKDLLANDTDVDGDNLQITSIYGVNGEKLAIDNGKVDLSTLGDGAFQLEYIVSDGKGASDTAKLQVKIEEAPPPADDIKDNNESKIDVVEDTRLPKDDMAFALNEPKKNSLANHEDINLGKEYAAKTMNISFTTGDDVHSTQVIYEQGGNIRGLNFFISDGYLYSSVYNLHEENWGYKDLGVQIDKDTLYNATLVMDGARPSNGTAKLFLNGNEVAIAEDVGILYAHRGAIGIGQINGNTILNGKVISKTSAFKGEIHNLVQYNAALSSNELDILHASFDTDTDLTDNISAPDNDNTMNIIRMASDTEELDIVQKDLKSHGQQDKDQNAAQVRKDMVLMDGNTWKSIDIGYNVTESTVLSFEFKSSAEGEIHAIGLQDKKNSWAKDEFVELYGTQDWADTQVDYQNIGEWETFTVNASDVFGEGMKDYLTFVNDDDKGSVTGNSAFKNIKLFESPDIDMLADQVYAGTRQADIFTFEEKPNDGTVFGIQEFEVGKDKLNIDNILQGMNSDEVALEDVLQLVAENGQTKVKVKDTNSDTFSTVTVLTDTVISGGISDILDSDSFLSNPDSDTGL